MDDAYKCMKRIDKFEEKHLPLRLEYRVIGELMNRLKEATGKDRFMLLQKLNRAMRLVQWKEAYDPNNPANYGVIQLEQEPQEEASKELDLDAGFEREIGAEEEDEEEDDFGEKDKDDILREKLEAIDKKLEAKLALLDITFGKKGRALEEEIKDIAEERNALTEKARRPLYRKVSRFYFVLLYMLLLYLLIRLSLYEMSSVLFSFPSFVCTIHFKFLMNYIYHIW